MVKRYLDGIKPFDNKNYKGGVCLLNNELRNKIFEDVYKYEFKQLYPNLLISFNEIGYLSNLNIDPSLINRVKCYLENPSDSERIWVNRLYVSELKSHTSFLFDLYYQYMLPFYKEIFDSNNIIYIDTDYFISKKEIDISEIGLKYEKIEIPYFWIKAFKKFIIQENGEIKTKGFISKYKDKEGNALFVNEKDLVGEIKKRIRNKKLLKILKFDFS